MKLRWFGIIGIIAAFLGCVADVLLLYAPNGGYERQDYLFFEQIPQWRLTLGHYLGVLVIPLELIGFWQVYQAIKSAGNKYVIPVMLATVYVMVIGVAYHAMVSIGGTVIRAKNYALLSEEYFTSFFDTIKFYFEPFGAILFVLFLFISAGLFYIIWFRKTLYPKWVAFFNPLFVYLAIVVMYLLFPQHIGSMLMVAGFNFSILILLSISTVFMWNR